MLRTGENSLGDLGWKRKLRLLGADSWAKPKGIFRKILIGNAKQGRMEKRLSPQKGEKGTQGGYNTKERGGKPNLRPEEKGLGPRLKKCPGSMRERTVWSRVGRNLVNGFEKG